jgi:hypothetical protein
MGIGLKQVTSLNNLSGSLEQGVCSAVNWILSLDIVAVLIAVFTGWNRVKSEREPPILAGGC